MRRTRLTMWLTRVLGLGVGAVLITWAILGPQLDGRAQLILGVLVAIKAIAMGVVLSLYARTHVRAMERYLNRLRELAQRLQEASVRDSLTGLYNHGYLLSRLLEEIGRAQRLQHPLSVVILDLDGFKEVNDRHGHLAGDTVLHLVAAAIQQQVRRHDIAARYGGDEFCLVLPATDRVGAQAVVEKLRAAVAALPERLDGWADNQFSFSCGIASYPQDGTTVHALIAAADAQLYLEKQVQRLELAHEHGALVQNLFYRIGEAIAQPSDPTERLNGVAEAVSTSLHLRSAGLFWYEDGGLRIAARYAAEPELEAALMRALAAEPLKPEENPGLQAVERNEVITLDRMSADQGVSERFAAIMPPGLWSQWTPIFLQGQPPAFLVLMGTPGEASPPAPGLARALARLLAGAIQNSLSYEEARRQRDQLAALADVGSLLLKHGPFEERLRQVAQRVVAAVGFDAVTILTWDPRGQQSILTSTYSQQAGHLAEEWERHIKQRPQFIEQLREASGALREPFVIDEPAEHRLILPFLQDIFRRGKIRSLLILPLLFEEQSLGSLAVLSARRNAFDPDTVALFGTIASQIASSTQVALLLQEVRDSYQQLRQNHLDAMLRLAAVAEARDPLTGNHLHRLRAYTEAIARRLGLSETEVTTLGHAAVVHDIGKLRVPDALLAKPDSLTEEERALIRRHPLLGEELLGENEFYQEARQVARWHHERWDGSGYPDGLRGEAIPLGVRIVSVADVLDALISRRPYKEAWPIERTIAYIREQRGKQFAPEVVDAFLALAGDGTLETMIGAASELGPQQPGLDERLVA